MTRLTKTSASWEAPHAYPFHLLIFLFSNNNEMRGTSSMLVSCVCGLCLPRNFPEVCDSRAHGFVHSRLESHPSFAFGNPTYPILSTNIFLMA